MTQQPVPPEPVSFEEFRLYHATTERVTDRRVVLFAERGIPIHQAHDREKVVFYDSVDDLSARLTQRLRPIAAGARVTTEAAAQDRLSAATSPGG